MDIICRTPDVLSADSALFIITSESGSRAGSSHVQLGEMAAALQHLHGMRHSRSWFKLFAGMLKQTDLRLPWIACTPIV